MLGRCFRVFIWLWKKITQNTDETLQWKKQNRILLAGVQALQQIQDCFRPGQHNRTLNNISGQESRNAFGPARNIFSTGGKKKTRIGVRLANFLTIKRSKYCFRPGKKWDPEYFRTCQHKGRGLLATWRKSCPGMLLAMQARTKIKDCFWPD